MLYNFHSAGFISEVIALHIDLRDNQSNGENTHAIIDRLVSKYEGIPEEAIKYQEINGFLTYYFMFLFSWFQENREHQVWTVARHDEKTRQSLPGEALSNDYNQTHAAPSDPTNEPERMLSGETQAGESRVEESQHGELQDGKAPKDHKVKANFQTIEDTSVTLPPNAATKLPAPDFAFRLCETRYGASGIKFRATMQPTNWEQKRTPKLLRMMHRAFQTRQKLHTGPWICRDGKIRSHEYAISSSAEAVERLWASSENCFDFLVDTDSDGAVKKLKVLFCYGIIHGDILEIPDENEGVDKNGATEKVQNEHAMELEEFYRQYYGLKYLGEQPDREKPGKEARL
ncbi:hypothetical protein BOTNAR_0177g00030 [Botryotinia narcissicola]|uniref:Uncharacterized protein n=1 Tax=Botryotinia narcissicola TaxID=278944 RepID=A0A4Z1IAL3_9HELO|nr:hypothetical protein BOTNAR_0177g00030 [Botryotinia narcissicola]